MYDNRARSVYLCEADSCGGLPWFQNVTSGMILATFQRPGIDNKFNEMLKSVVKYIVYLYPVDHCDLTSLRLYHLDLKLLT